MMIMSSSESSDSMEVPPAIMLLQDDGNHLVEHSVTLSSASSPWGPGHVPILL